MRKMSIGWTCIGDRASIAHTYSPEKLPVWLAKIVCKTFKDTLTELDMDQDIELLFRSFMLGLVDPKLYGKENDTADSICMFNLTTGTIDVYSGKLDHPDVVALEDHPFESVVPQSSTWCPELPLLASAKFCLILDNKDGMDRVRKELEESVLGLGYGETT